MWRYTLVAASLLFCTQLSADWKRPEYIAQSFYEVALGSEFGGNALKIHKWVAPIRLFADHRVANETLHNSLLDAHIAHLIKITGMDIQRVSSAQQSNFRFIFTRESELKSLLKRYSGGASVKHERGAVCLASIRTNANAEITSATVYIPVDRARMHGKLVACVVEELTQALGLPRDSEKVFPSIFNDRTPDDLLTGLDDILLRVLYDARINAGMNQARLKGIVPQIINELNAKGMIKSAEQRVRQQSGLYQLLN